jgi:murein DD-endopeptidase MepM/ murein hydrolase activator NlpD
LNEHRKPHIGHWILTFAFFSLALFLVGKNTSDFHASVIPTQIAAPFNGTTLPVLNVPKWTSLGKDLYKASYDQIPADKMIPLPKYDANQLKTPTEQLGWKTESDLAVRNAKITFSVPYLGNYKLDGVENAGSHPAVDIKVPDGTPVYAIANGIVIQVAEQTTGFGNHIVIKHENVPSLTDPNAKTTIYSSYNHLSEVDIAEGDAVTKGQFIGKSGHSGTATTPHVHFQIDNDQAPWHPYWPFTYQEATAAGLTFFDAVSAGLNADKAKAATINPMMYVQKYLDGSGTSAVANTTVTPSATTTNTTTAATTTPSSNTPVVNTPAVVTPPVNTTVTNTVTPPAQNTNTSTATAASSATALEIENDGTFVANAPETIQVKAVDSAGSIVKSYKPSDAVYLEVLLGGADLPQSINQDSFSDGAASVTITPKSAGGLQLKATDGKISGESAIMKASLFSDIDESSTSYKAVTFLKNQGVITGYPDGSFNPEKVVSRVESLKFILKGANSRLITDAKLPFKDTKLNQWYSDYIATGYSKNIIAGYKDKTFRPENTVNRVEFLKMLISSMDLRISPVATRDPYSDVSKDAWYAPYVQYAKYANLVDVSGDRFRPEEGMTREEVAETMYRTIMLKLSGADKYSDSIAVSSSDISRYFS